MVIICPLYFYRIQNRNDVQEITPSPTSINGRARGKLMLFSHPSIRMLRINIYLLVFLTTQNSPWCYLCHETSHSWEYAASHSNLPLSIYCILLCLCS